MKTRCYKCEGKGWTRKPVDLFFAFATLGLTALMDLNEHYVCETCDGCGYITDN
jgi:predicted nucleic-acid-binding Zn-ribbon protein